MMLSVYKKVGGVQNFIGFNYDNLNFRMKILFKIFKSNF